MSGTAGPASVFFSTSELTASSSSNPAVTACADPNMEHGKVDVTVTLRQLLSSKSRPGRHGDSPPMSPPFVWDSESNQSTTAISPISNQDLIPGSNQDMPVSSTAFSWTQSSEHSLTSSISRGHSTTHSHSLSDWTHFGESVSENVEDPHNILKQLLKDPDNLDDSKEIRHWLGSESALGMSNGSPNNMHHDPSYSVFLQNLDVNTSNPGQKRKLDELEGAETGHPAKLSDKNKLLASLLQNTTRQQSELPASGLPTPSPGDLPQNKLPKDLPSRILPAVGQQRALLQNGPQRNGNGGANNGGGGGSSGGGSLSDFLMDSSMFASRNGISQAEQMDIFDLIGELQDDFGTSDLSQSGPLTPVDKQAIESIRQNLIHDFSPSGPSPTLMNDSMPYRDQSAASPGAMNLPKYNINMSQGSSMPRPQMHNFSNSGDMMLQRMSGPGPGVNNHMMLPNHVSPGPPARPGMPQEFTTSRSPVPPSAMAGNGVRQQIRLNSLSRQGRAQAQQNNFNIGQPAGSMQMTNVPPNVTVNRSFSIPNAGQHGGYPVNGFQNVPQQNSPQRFSQQTVPYSSPPPNMQFQVPGQNQPLSPRMAGSQSGGRLTRPNHNPALWMQQQQQQQQQQSQMVGLGNQMGGGGAGNAMQVGNQMNVGGGGSQQNPPPYGNQQFMSQAGSPNFGHPGQMLQHQQQNMGQQPMQRFSGPGGGQVGFNPQQNMMQQQQQQPQDAFGNGGQFYGRGMPVNGGGGQQRMTPSGQNPQMMRSGMVNNLADDLRANDGAFSTGPYQMNGINSAPASANPQQQQQPFRWDMPTDRQIMSVPPSPRINSAGSGGGGSGSSSLIPAPNLDQGFQHFDSFFDSPSSGALNGLNSGQHMNDQQFGMFPNDNRHMMGQMQQNSNQQQQQPHSGQFPSLTSASSCVDLNLMSMSHPGNNSGHQPTVLQPGDRSKSLLQQLLSETSVTPS